jgi:hypothetical protein
LLQLVELILAHVAPSVAADKRIGKSKMRHGGGRGLFGRIL